MTELETMQRAKMYMDKLAKGIDPVTDRKIAEDSVLNHVRLARCFNYVSDVLSQVIANGGTVGQKGKTLDFTISPRQLSEVRLSDDPVRITEFTEALYQAVNNPGMKKLSAVKITDWLVSAGLMLKEMDADGKAHRIPTQRGFQMGMTTRKRQSRDGEYIAVYYDKNMQRFLLNHMSEILENPRSNG